MYWKFILLCMVSLVTCMEPEVQITIPPRVVSPEVIVRQLSLYIFNRDADSHFEKLFLDILCNKKNPQLFPELISMREHIIRELQYRIRE